MALINLGGPSMGQVGKGSHDWKGTIDANFAKMAVYLRPFATTIATASDQVPASAPDHHGVLDIEASQLYYYVDGNGYGVSIERGMLIYVKDRRQFWQLTEYGQWTPIIDLDERVNWMPRELCFFRPGAIQNRTRIANHVPGEEFSIVSSNPGFAFLESPPDAPLTITVSGMSGGSFDIVFAAGSTVGAFDMKGVDRFTLHPANNEGEEWQSAALSIVAQGSEDESGARNLSLTLKGEVRSLKTNAAFT